MADEKNENGEETPVDEPADESSEPAAEAEAVAEEAPAAEVAADSDEAEAEAEPEVEVEPELEVAAEEPAGEPEPVAEAEVVSEDAAEAAAPSAEDASSEAAAPAAAGGGTKPKKKRVPRPLRRQRTKTRAEKPATRKPIVRLEKPEHDRGRRQERLGTVISSAMDKTIVVKVDTLKAHPRYKKVVRRSTTFHAHDESNQANVGDVVRIVETRPLSKTKRWRLAEIVEAAR